MSKCEAGSQPGFQQADDQDHPNGIYNLAEAYE